MVEFMTEIIHILNSIHTHIDVTLIPAPYKG